jgi:hypothetical protein
MSRSHFKVSLKGGQCVIEDLGSTNKTYVNGRFLEPKTPVALNFGDEVYSGSQRFIVSREPHLPEAKIAIPTPVYAPNSASMKGPELPLATWSEVFHQMLRPSCWTNYDRIHFGFSILLAGALLYLFFEPVLSHGRWKFSQFANEEFVNLISVFCFHFFTFFSAVRRNPRFRDLPEWNRIIRTISVTVLFLWAFAPEGTAWQPAARKDIVRSCYKAESRDPEQCRKALEIAETVGTHLTRKGLVPVSQFLNNDEFINHYAERNHLADPERAPATAQEPKSNP